MSTRCVGPLDLELHQVEQVGAAADELGAGPPWRPRRSRRRGVGRALVGERLSSRALLPRRRGWRRRCWDRRRNGRCCRSCARGSPRRSARCAAPRRRRWRGWASPPSPHEHADGRADLARRAVAALESVVLDKRRLQRMQRAGPPTPSMVTISSPSCITASVRHELMRRPLTSTVQAPHCPWSQPFLVPVRWRCSRSASSKVVRVSSSAVCSVAVDA